MTCCFLLLWHGCSNCVAWQVVLSSSISHSTAHCPSPHGASQIQPAHKHGPVSRPLLHIFCLLPGVCWGQGLCSLPGHSQVPAGTARLAYAPGNAERSILHWGQLPALKSKAWVSCHMVPLLMTSAAHLNVHHSCGYVLHSSASFWVCGSPASTSNSADGWYKRGL